MPLIRKIVARQVLDSRGNPTIEAEAHSGANSALAIVPSGASTGSREALELRDGGKEFMGKSVSRAVSNVNKTIAPKIVGMDSSKQQEIDAVMIGLDGTENKSNLGANAILSVSMAVARLGALEAGIPLYSCISKLSGAKKLSLPVPQMNVINGGAHAGQENDIQEHMVMPLGAKTYSAALRAGVETYHALKARLKKKFGAAATLVGDEGGFVPQGLDFEQRLELIASAAEDAGYANEIRLAVDAAASEFYSGGKYTIGAKNYSSGELVDFYSALASKYKIFSLEDGMAETDWQGWSELTSKLGKRIQIVADDLTVTNPKIIKEAAEKKAANSLLLKANQIGTVTEAIDAANLAVGSGWTVVVSHRSGESEDAFIADLAVGLDAGQCKFGAPARSERTCKYNQLLRIEEELSAKGKAEYAGQRILKR